MRICVNGFGEYADTLHILIPSHADWKEFTNVLSIVGVIYYYVQGSTIGVRYIESVDPIDVAAQPSSWPQTSATSLWKRWK